jgi:competence protein ComEC
MILFAPMLWPQPLVDPLDRLIAGARPWPVKATRYIAGSFWRLWLTGALIWLVALPIVWLRYNILSPIALVLNTVIWIPITAALYGGFGALVLGAIAPPLGAAAGWMCDGCLLLMELAIAYGRELPWSYFWLPAPPAWWVGLFYVALGLAAVFPPLRPARWWWCVLPLAWFAGALALSTTTAKSWTAAPLNSSHGEPRLACSFVAVGHGVACLIELPDGRTILYDAGKLGSPLAAVRPISSALWSRGIRHLDAIVISHADSDHFCAVPELLDRFSVGAIYVSPVMFQSAPPAVQELRAAIDRAGVPLREIYATDRLRSDAGVRLEVLHPPRKGVIGSDNANSIVLLIEYAGRRVLLTGDLESPGLDDMLAEEPLDCDVIMAPHHGSRRSDPTGFCLWSTPEVAVISGSRNFEDVPDIEAVKDSYRARGAHVYHTAEDGWVRIEIGSGGMTTTSFRPHAGTSLDLSAADFPPPLGQ